MPGSRVPGLPEVIRCGDAHRTWETLYRLVQSHICRTLRLPPVRLRSLEDDDVLAEATYRALDNITRYGSTFRGTSEGEAGAWVRAVARRAALHSVMRSGNRLRRQECMDPGSLERIAPVDLSGVLTRADARRILDRAVPNPRWRTIWMLHNLPGRSLSHEEIARRVGRTPGTVAVTLSRVRSAIREEMESLCR